MKITEYEHDIGLNMLSISEESARNSMNPLSQETMSQHIYSLVALNGNQPIGYSAITKIETIIDKRNADWWQEHQFAVLG